MVKAAQTSSISSASAEQGGKDHFPSGEINSHPPLQLGSYSDKKDYPVVRLTSILGFHFRLQVTSSWTILLILGFLLAAATGLTGRKSSKKGKSGK